MVEQGFADPAFLDYLEPFDSVPELMASLAAAQAA
jgi:hypothetical protein